MAAVPQFRWGIVSAGNISNDFTNALRYVAAKNLKSPGPGSTSSTTSSSKVSVTCVGARNIDASQKFAKLHGIPKAYGSYDEIFNDSEVDIVYIGAINTGHYELTIKALNAGKHVVCEKPLGLNLSEVEAMQKVAKEKNRFLLEGLWTRFFPLIKTLKKLLFEEKAIGNLKTMTADFGIVCGREAKRMYDINMGGGALLDLGIYPLSFLPLTFGCRAPTSISSEGSVCPLAGVDLSGFLSVSMGKHSGSESYSESKPNSDDNFHTPCASVSWSMNAATPEEVIISGDKGYIRVCGSAHTPTKLVVARMKGRGFENQEIEESGGPSMEDMKVTLTTGTADSESLGFEQNYPGSQGFVFEVEAAHNAILRGKTECEEWTWEETRYVANLMDTWRKKMGVKYPGEE